MSINQDVNSPIPDVDIDITSNPPNIIIQSNQIAPLTPINETQKNEETISTSLTSNLNIKENNKININDIIKNLRNETIQLFLKIFQVKSITLKLYLILLLAFVSCLCSYTIVILTVSYLSYDVITTSRQITETSSVFPKVTICNSNPFQTEYAVEFLKEINKRIDPTLNIFEIDKKEILAYNNYTFNDLNGLSKQIFEQAIALVGSSNFTVNFCLTIWTI